MTEVKIQCVSCGFQYPNMFIQYYYQEPYCDICYFDLLRNNSCATDDVLPSYYLSKTHKENFSSLMDKFSKKDELNWYSIAIAYILGIPDIYNHKLLDHVFSKKYIDFFQAVHFIWQFDFIIWEFKESYIGNQKFPSTFSYCLKKDENGLPVQNKIVRDMNYDCQVILKLGFYLQFDFLTEADIEELFSKEYLLISEPYKKLINELIGMMRWAIY